MAQISGAGVTTSDIKVATGNSISSVIRTFSPTVIAATVTNLDRILLATLPANSRIIGCSVRIIGTSGLTSITHLQTTEPTGNNIFLTPTSGAQASPSVALMATMSAQHLGITTGLLSTTGTRDLELVVATGSFSVTNGLIVAVEATFVPYV